MILATHQQNNPKITNRKAPKETKAYTLEF
jgi:hypothetical protein